MLSGHFEWAFPAGTWWVPYVAFAAAVMLGTLLRRRGGKSRLTTAVLMGLVFEVGFFAFSNFFVWLCQDTYPQTLAGLRD